MPTPTTHVYFDHIVCCLYGIPQCNSQGIIALTDKQNTLACKLPHAWSDFCCHTFMHLVLPPSEEVHARLLTLCHHRLEEEHLMHAARPPCLPPSSCLCGCCDSLSVLDMHDYPSAPILCPPQQVPLSCFLSFCGSPHCLTFFPCPDHMVSSYLQLSILTSDSASCPNMCNKLFFFFGSIQLQCGGRTASCTGEQDHSRVTGTNQGTRRWRSSWCWQSCFSNYGCTSWFQLHQRLQDGPL